MLAPLGKSTIFASQSSAKQVRAYIARAKAKQQSQELTQEQVSQSARRKRFALQDIARELLPGHRVGVCLRMFEPGKQGEVWRAQKIKRAHYKKLCVCGASWVCPVCSSKISERRRAELDKALRSCSHKYQAVMVTITLAHEREDTLISLLEALKSAWRSLKAGRWYQSLKERYGIVGSVSALEVTIGKAHGWHPHQHSLMFCKPGINVQELEQELKAKWQQVISSQERFANFENGLTAYKANWEAGKYLAKQDTWSASSELTKANSKTGSNGEHYHPFELLELWAQEREEWYANMFKEYASALHGKHALQWTKGMRALLGLTEQQETDEELARREEEDSIFMLRFTQQAWSKVLKQSIRAEVLEVASDGDVYKLTQYLERFGVLAGEISTVQEEDDNGNV